MSFLRDFFGEGDVLDILAGGQADVADIFGRQAGRAGQEAADLQQQAVLDAIEEERRGRAAGQEFLAPFGGVGLQGVEQAGFLTDPQAQFDFLQNNPLFQLALENANQQTGARAASTGRLSAGDTLSQLSNNVLLSAQPLIGQQKRSILDLLGFGGGIAQTQANVAIGEGSNVSSLLTDIGNVGAAGIASRQQANQQGVTNAIKIAGSIFSDPRLKKNKKVIGRKNGFTLWKWDWNGIAKKLGLSGSSFGVMFDEVLKKHPEAASYKDGFGRVDYAMIGVQHGN